MSEHRLEIVSEGRGGEVSIRLVCTAVKGAPCKQRPANIDQETWTADDPGLVDVDDCWAIEHVDAFGFEDAVRCAVNGTLASFPVGVGYDEGVVVTPIDPHSTLDLKLPATGLDTPEGSAE